VVKGGGSGGQLEGEAGVGSEGKLLGPRHCLWVVVVDTDCPSWWSALSVSSPSSVVVILHHFWVVVMGSYCHSSWWVLDTSSSFCCFVLVSSGIVT